MSELKRTQLYDVHVQAGATMVDFGGWEMPIQYPSGIVSEHLYTRHACSLFDVSHMGRLLVEGPDRLAFLQHVLTSNVAGLDLNMAQYCIIPAPRRQAPWMTHICTALRKSGICWWSTPPTPTKTWPTWRPPGRSLTAPSPTSQPNMLPLPSRAPRAKSCFRFSPAAWQLRSP